MKYGLSDAQLQEIVDILSSYKEVEQAILFGSRAINTNKEASDIDIAIKGKKSSLSIALDIKEQLEEETYLPFLFDIISYNTIQSDELREHINQKGISIYKAGVSEWREVFLEDITTKIGDGLHGTPKYDSNGEYYFINGNNFKNGKIIVKPDTKKVTKDEAIKYQKSLSNKTLLLSINGTIGNLALYNFEKCMLGKSACYINVSDKVDVKFLYYHCLDEEFQFYIEMIATGTTIPNVPLKGIRQYSLNLPILPEQKAIAEVLSSLDDKIDLLHRQNTTLEEMAQTLFRQWFIDYESKKYKYYSLNELVSHLKPGTNFQPKRVKKGIPFLNVRNLSNGFIDSSDLKYITEEEYKRVHKAWQPEENDILISRIGTLGLVATIRKEDLPIAVHYNMINLKADKTSFQFIYYLLKSEYFQVEYDIVKRSSVQEYVAIEDAKNLQIPLYEDANEFNNFEKQFIPLFNKTESNFNQIKTLENMRDTLLPKLMSGEVRVKT